jgi:hypothetical protein
MLRSLKLKFGGEVSGVLWRDEVVEDDDRWPSVSVSM